MLGTVFYANFFFLLFCFSGDRTSIHQLKKMADFQHTDLELVTVCRGCDLHVLSVNDKVCAKCQFEVQAKGCKRQFVCINIVAKMQRLFANPDFAQKLHYSVLRDDSYPGDVWDIDRKLKRLTKEERLTTRYLCVCLSVCFVFSLFFLSSLYCTDVFCIIDTVLTQWTRAGCKTTKNIHRLC
jgi:hypothetical protein